MPSHVDVSFPFGASTAIHPVSSTMNSIPPYPLSFPAQLLCRMDKNRESKQDFFPPPSSIFHNFLRPGFPLLPPVPTSTSTASDVAEDPRESLADRIERERRQDEEREALQRQNLPAPAEERHTSFMVKDILSNRTPIHKPIPKHPASCTTCNCIRQSNDQRCGSNPTSPTNNSSSVDYLKFGVSNHFVSWRLHVAASR